MRQEVFDLFKVVVVDESRIRDEVNMDHVEHGFITDFTPTMAEIKFISEACAGFNLRTLFSRQEREHASADHLICKQILNYIETYGLGAPGLFNLETDAGKKYVIRFVRGVTQDELAKMVHKLMYENAPIADVPALVRIIRQYEIPYDVSEIANNELRVSVFNPGTDRFKNGDDVVRYMCFKATGQPMLIKSKDVVSAVSGTSFGKTFLARHENELAQVFNRHKSLIMTLKDEHRNLVNRVSRKSKKLHVPLREAINKTFVALALKDRNFDMGVLSRIGVRDKLKFLNLLAHKRSQATTDAFIIRNGKVFTKTGRRVFQFDQIARVENAVINSLKVDLQKLHDKTILLDPDVDYGLPTSRKQAVGQLPYGTRVAVDQNEISAGIFWKNEWGATDLDLSAIDENGHRTGWGQYSGYDRRNPIAYSGDMTYASGRGAMEFMTSREATYGLFVNIFSGQNGAKAKIVVGEGRSSGRGGWMDKPVIEEEITLASRGTVIGFVRNGEFIVYTGRLSERRANFGEKPPVMVRGLGDWWNVTRLLDRLGIKYDLEPREGVQYDHDLIYNGFSYDKLEDMLLS